ncbi:MAG: 3-deoxy-D-manno-octulosonic acid transferase, partial [Pseudomonadota bacterium]
MIPAGAVWALYRTAGTLASPLAAPYLARRVRRGKEDPDRAREKRGFASASLADRPIWLHAVSVGESVAALPLARRLEESGFAVLFTTGTPTASARLSSEAPELVHQFAPLDAPPFLHRFLGHWRPRAALFTEQEIWPTTLTMLARAQIPRAHVNARLSARSCARWKKSPALAKALFKTISVACAQTAQDAARFGDLGAGEVHLTGNLKFDSPPPPALKTTVAALREAIGERPVWLAASLHPGEESFIVEVHRRLKERWPDVVSILAPRHPATADLISAAAKTAGVSTITRRTAGDPPRGLYIADTLGEMGVLFSVAPVTFLGGSFVPVGGHNPAEPAAFDSALLTGPSHGAMFEPFVDQGGA